MLWRPEALAGVPLQCDAALSAVVPLLPRSCARVLDRQSISPFLAGHADRLYRWEFSGHGWPVVVDRSGNCTSRAVSRSGVVLACCSEIDDCRRHTTHVTAL